MHLPSLTDEELISLVRTQNDLVTSDLERELAERLKQAIDAADENSDFEKQIELLEEEKYELETKISGLEDKIADIQSILKEKDALAWNRRSNATRRPSRRSTRC